jgi:hypothetical protein
MVARSRVSLDNSPIIGPNEQAFRVRIGKMVKEDHLRNVSLFISDKTDMKDPKIREEVFAEALRALDSSGIRIVDGGKG